MLIPVRRFLSRFFLIFSLVCSANFTLLTAVNFLLLFIPFLPICGVSFSRTSIRFFFFTLEKRRFFLLRLFLSFYFPSSPSFSAFSHILRHKIDKFLHWLFNRLLDPWIRRTAEAHIYASVWVDGTKEPSFRRMSEIEDWKEQRLRQGRFHRNWFLAQRVLLSMPACVIYDSINRFAVIDEKIQAKIQANVSRFFFRSFYV